jgi:hypothetical protein
MIEEVSVKSFIIVTKTLLSDEKTLKDKIERKFKKVNITPVIATIDDSFSRSSFG